MPSITPTVIPSKVRFVAVLLGAATWLLVGAVAAAVAQADDLLVLNGDSVALQGAHQYGLVYIDGALKLTGDTSISANSIYIGPDAYLDTCYVDDAHQNSCTSGRSLTLSAGGPVTVAQGIDLTAGSGTVRSAGSLSLTGSPVDVGGDVNTSGSGYGTSGTVTVVSHGALGIGGIYAPGASVSLSAQGAVDVAGPINTAGNSRVGATGQTQMQSGAPVTVGSSAGAVRIAGDIDASGVDALKASGLGGGNGAAVTISGTDVRTGAVSSAAGQSAAGSAGLSAPISVTATGTLSVLGRLDASGENAGAGGGAPGSSATLHAGGALSAENIYVGGGQGPGGGAPGGQIMLTGASAQAQTLDVSGAGAPQTPGAPGGAGGSITVTAPSGASLGNLQAGGGNAYNAGSGGPGGQINVTSTAGAIATGSALATGGSAGHAGGSPGGPITLSAATDLSAGGQINSSGSDAGAAATPPFAGANAGVVVLRAGTGTLGLAGGVYAQGGGGGSSKAAGNVGGAGGAGANVDVIAHAVGSLGAISARGGDGGDYGKTQGPGGAGGAITVWTDAPIFNAQVVVTSQGGNGNPAGTAGAKRQNSSPSGLAISPLGVLSFTSNSPDATGFRALGVSVGSGSTGATGATGPTGMTLAQTNATAGVKIATPLCQTERITVVAQSSAIAWTSDPSNTVAFTRQPSDTQSCADAPLLTVAANVVRSRTRLRAAGWVAALTVSSSGIGTLAATLERRSKFVRGKQGRMVTRASRTGPLARASIALSSSGRLTIHLRMPPAARIPGRYVVRLITTAPNGQGRSTANLGLEIR
ncbi:MAG: beta strand repeat-containing protein [Solirubrobacteraceae bacterium]